MTPAEDEDAIENDVNYGIADCRRRVRSRRSTLRAQHPPKDQVGEPWPQLTKKLLATEQLEEREEAVIT